MSSVLHFFCATSLVTIVAGVLGESFQHARITGIVIGAISAFSWWMADSKLPPPR